MIEYSKIDKACYVISLICLILGISVSISLIWFENNSQIAEKIIGTLALIFVLCIGVLILNKLIRSSGRYADKIQ